MLRTGLFALLASSALLACSGSETSELTLTSGSGGMVDNRFKPNPTGVRTDEANACGQISSAIVDRQLTLKCVGTVQQCPAMVRSSYGTACMEYDAGTVEACVAYFKKAKTCDELVPGNCVLVGYPESAPLGCP
jgi:hypothetical protein